LDITLLLVFCKRGRLQLGVTIKNLVTCRSHFSYLGCREKSTVSLWGILQALVAVILVGTLAANCQARAATYYVATTGSDSNPGTITNPFRTISYAYGSARGQKSSTAQCGDTIMVQPGTYTDSHQSSTYGILLNKACTSSSPIIIKSVILHGATIDEQQDTTRQHAITVEGGTYNTVDGFRITNSWRTCIVDYSDPAIGFNTYQNNEIDHCGLDNIAADNEHGAFYLTGNNDKVLSNFIHDIGPWPGHSSDALNMAGDGFLVANNIISTVSTRMHAIQVAPKTGVVVTSGKIYNNTLINNPQGAITLYTYGGKYKGLQIENNIMANNGGSIAVCQSAGSGVVANSNIDYNNSSAEWVDNCGGTATITHTDINWIRANPLFVGATDYHLQPGSPAIGAGLTLPIMTDDFDGNPRRPPYDIGAYVTSSSILPIKLPTNLVQNPGFESGLSNWSDWGNNTLVVVGAYDGTYSLMTGTGNGGVGQQISGLNPGNTYVMAVAAKTGSHGDLGGWLGVEFIDNYGNVVGLAHVNVSSTSWTKYTLTIVAPSSFSSAEVYAWKNSGASFLFVDDFSLTKL
jgi:hypothetical protein